MRLAEKDVELAERYAMALERIAAVKAKMEEFEDKPAFPWRVPGAVITLVLTATGDKKINVIKAIRIITGLGLKEAKDLVEGAPQIVKEGLSKEDANKFAEVLRAAGATVEIR
jgi:ribosomal protein L7/L12